MGSRINLKKLAKRMWQSSDTASNQSTEEEIYSDDILPDLKDIKIGKRIYSGKDLEEIASKDHVGLFKRVFQNMYPITRTKSGLPKKPRNTSQKENLVQRLKNKFTVLRFDILHNMRNKGDSTILRESIQHLEDIKQLINHFEENETTSFPYDLLETYIQSSDIDLFSDDIDEEMSKSYIKQKENMRIKNLLRQFAKIYLQDEYKSNYDLYDPGMSQLKFDTYLKQADEKKLVPVALGNLIRFLRDDYTSKSSSDADYSKLLDWINEVHDTIINTTIPEETQEATLNALLQELANLRDQQQQPQPQVGGDVTSELASKKTEIQGKITELVGKYKNMKSKYEIDVRFTLDKIRDCNELVVKCRAELDEAKQRVTEAAITLSATSSELAAANAKFTELSEKIKLIKSRLNLDTADATDDTELRLLEKNLNSIQCQLSALKVTKDAALVALAAANAEKDAALEAQAALIAEANAEKDRRDLAATNALAEANAHAGEATARAAAAEAQLAKLTNQPTTTGVPVDQVALDAARDEAREARDAASKAAAEVAAAKEAEAAAKADATAKIDEATAAAKADATAQIAAANAEAQSQIAAARAAAQGELQAAIAAAQGELQAAIAAAQQATQQGTAAAQARIKAADARVRDVETQATATAAQAAAAATEAADAARTAASNNAAALAAAQANSYQALRKLRDQQRNALNKLNESHRAKMSQATLENRGYLAEIDEIRLQSRQEKVKSTAQITLLLSVLEKTKDMASNDAENNIQTIYDTLMTTIGNFRNYDNEDQKNTITEHIKVIKEKLISLIEDKGKLQTAAALAAAAAAVTAAAVAAQAAETAAQISSAQGAASAAAADARASALEAAAAAEDAARLRDSLAASSADLSGARVRIQELEEQIAKLSLPTPAVPIVPTMPSSMYRSSFTQEEPVQPVPQSSTIEQLIKNILNDPEINKYLSGYMLDVTKLSKLLKRLYQFGLFTAETRTMITVKAIQRNNEYDNLTLLIDSVDNMVNNYINNYRKNQPPGKKVLLESDLTDPSKPYYKYDLLATIFTNQLKDEDGLKNLTQKMIEKLKSIRRSIAQRSTINPMRDSIQRGGLHSMSLDIANNRYNNNLLEETNPFYSIIEKFDKTSNTNMIERANESIMMERFLDTMLKDHFTDIEMKEFFFQATNILDKKSCDNISTLCFELLEICKIVELSDKNMDVIFIENTSLNVDFDKLETKIKECPYDFFEHAKKEFPNKKEISLGFFKNGIYLYLETNKFDKMYTIDKQNELHLANFDFNEEIYYINNHMLYLFFIICNKIINKKKFAELDSYIRKQKRSKTKRMSTLLKERKEIN